MLFFTEIPYFNGFEVMNFVPYDEGSTPCYECTLPLSHKLMEPTVNGSHQL